MFTIIFSLFYSIRQVLRNRAAPQAEILALRHQLLVLQRSNGRCRPRLRFADRLLCVWLSQLWSGWRSALMIVKPETATLGFGESSESIAAGLGGGGNTSGFNPLFQKGGRLRFSLRSGSISKYRGVI